MEVSEEPLKLISCTPATLYWPFTCSHIVVLDLTSVSAYVHSMDYLAEFTWLVVKWTIPEVGILQYTCGSGTSVYLCFRRFRMLRKRVQIGVDDKCLYNSVTEASFEHSS